MTSEIQIWQTFDKPIPIRRSILDNGLLVEIKEAEPLPDDLEAKVKANWADVKKKSPNSQNNPILFLANPPYKLDSGALILPTTVRGFSYTHAFNRNKEFHDMTAELNAYRLLSISTHGHIVTSDGKMVFGTKKNQFNQISGFSGFPNVNEDSANLGSKIYLDIRATVANRLRPEIGGLVSHITDIDAVGIVYTDTRGLRGLDTDYLFRLDVPAKEVQKKFQESFQFEKQLHVVDYEPEALRNFFRQVHSEGKQMSKYALGCSTAIMKTYFGADEAQAHIETIRELGITISMKNETSYFS